MRRYFNRYYMLGLVAIGSLAACTQGQTKKEQDIQKQALLQEIRDSLELDSFRRAQQAEQALAESPSPAENPSSSQGYYPEYEDYNEPAYSSQEPVYESEPAGSYEAPRQQRQKKGWSAAAKGTAIGAGVGAGMGILIDKDKRGRGAAIGALIGGGSGYLIGRKKDRQSGRVQK